MPSKSRTLLYFFVAVLLASALGSVLQTQFESGQSTGARVRPLPLGVRLQTTCLDFAGL